MSREENEFLARLGIPDEHFISTYTVDELDSKLAGWNKEAELLNEPVPTQGLGDQAPVEAPPVDQWTIVDYEWIDRNSPDVLDRIVLENPAKGSIIAGGIDVGFDTSSVYFEDNHNGEPGGGGWSVNHNGINATTIEALDFYGPGNPGDVPDQSYEGETVPPDLAQIVLQAVNSDPSIAQDIDGYADTVGY